MEKKKLYFKDIRPYVSRIDRVSILFPDGTYQNYRFIKHVPDSFDDYILRGFGVRESEFRIEDAPSKSFAEENRINDEFYFDHCIEIFIEKESEKKED